MISFYKIKNKLHLLRYKYFCRKWKRCVNLTWNQEWTLCNDKKCPLFGMNSMTRAYKKTIGEYDRNEDIGINEK